MRAFVLCTGRCGSVTLSKALRHAENFTASHQSDPKRRALTYPDNHVAVDPLLVWIAPLVRERYPDARWFRLHRDPEQVAASFNRRWHRPLIRSWAGLVRTPRDIETCRQYVRAVEAHIERHGYERSVELGSDDDFIALWDALGAEGDLDAALKTWNTPHNVSSR